MFRHARIPAFAVLLLLFLLGGPPARADGEAETEAQKPGVPDAELQKAIDEAIDRGAAWLESEQKGNGGLGGIEGQGGVTHHEVGTSSLAGLALLAAGRKRGDASVDRLYAYLKNKDTARAQAGSRATYGAGVLLMFITAYWRDVPVEKPRGRTRTGRRAKNPCNLPEDVLAWVQELANFLVRARKAATATWGYPQHRDDHSNTQYAFLGLRAARDCGAKIPSIVFVQAAKTMLERQEQDGPKVLRVLPSPDPQASPYVIDGGDRARGWSYMQAPFMPTGSMTTSGIAILAICHDALLHPKRFNQYDGKLERTTTRAIQDGFSWLDKNWAVDKNPGIGAMWHYYYLYGLERACVFGGRDLIGQHDWYIEGARLLVNQQQADGRWSTGQAAWGDGTFKANEIVDTAWAILFLAKATRPMEPIRPPVVTPGG